MAEEPTAPIAPADQTAPPGEEDEQPISLASEFLLFLRENKKWWLLPILITIAVLGVLVFLGSSPAAPFIYTLF